MEINDIQNRKMIWMKDTTSILHPNFVLARIIKKSNWNEYKGRINIIHFAYLSTYIFMYLGIQKNI